MTECEIAEKKVCKKKNDKILLTEYDNFYKKERKDGNMERMKCDDFRALKNLVIDLSGLKASRAHHHAEFTFFFLPGMMSPAPWSPYPSSGGTISFLFSPTHMPRTPSSHPLIT